MTDNVYTFTPEDEAIITEQLGRTPRGVVDIAARSRKGIPLVLSMRSWVANAPFPTLFWLCSRDLHKAINAIETAGFVKNLEARVEQEQALKLQLLADQMHYHQLRDNALRDEDRFAIEKAGLTDVFNQFGIGGIKQWDKIRCLHMHYAFHLALKADGEESVVGKILDDEFDLHQLTLSF
jgi:hypothetical protein